MPMFFIYCYSQTLLKECFAQTVVGVLEMYVFETALVIHSMNPVFGALTQARSLRCSM